MNMSQFGTSRLKCVVLTSQVYSTCILHALSTEKEEVMGLFLGEWQVNPTHEAIAYVTDSMILQRSDKRKDRVEVSPEQLHLAVLQAESASKEQGRHIRVIGWYHSHPHITVYPSDVDLATQERQQQLDPRFFGSIFSCFDENQQDQSQRLQTICFQSKRLANPSGFERLKSAEIPFGVAPAALTRTLLANPQPPLYQLPASLLDELKQLYQVQCSTSDPASSSLAQRFCSSRTQLEYINHLSVLAEHVLLPLLTSLAQRRHQQREELKALQSRLDYQGHAVGNSDSLVNLE
ncbi:BRCA1 BRCA2-containing complex, subunit 3 [Dispira parvispora]|uniref:BRCA1 BRCA2-containing complex, subunit 3 n=1 Tax=Dispira parvispora TaxID=1520584 RepID=A0A9W8E401_9FUNG|nr:BRCA1 BRCA2-containing complex, subunit 3 [Dispira parvispora]